MDILKQFNLPSYLKGKSFSEASKCLADKFEGRNSPEDVATLNDLQGRLKSAQEHVKSKYEKPNPQGMPQGQGMQGGAPGGVPQQQGQEMPQEMTSRQEARPQEGSEYNFGGTLAKMFGAGAGNPEAEGFAGTQVGAGFEEGASSSQIAGSAMGIAGGAMALGDMANTAFGDTGIDTTGRSGAVEVGSTGGAVAGGAIKGVSAGKAFGPWGAAIGGVLGAGSGFLGNKKAKKDALEAKFNSALAEHNAASGKYAKYGGQLGKKYETGGDLYNEDLPMTNALNFLTPYGLSPMKGGQPSEAGLSLSDFEKRKQYSSEDIAGGIADEDYMNGLTSFANSLGSNNGSEYVKESQEITQNNEDLFKQSAEDNLNKSKVNPMENLRYAAPLMNIAQLASLKKPEDVNLGRIDSKYEKNYVDERSMQNMAKESALNTRNALMSASGGSGARASANLLASQTLGNKAMSDAYFKSTELNRAEDRAAQNFDMKSNVRNLMQGNQETAYNLEREAAYKQNKSDLMAAIGNDLGGIGQEELFKKYPEMMGLGYDPRGNAVGREESAYDESFATKKTSGEENKKAKASLGEDSKANNFRTKPSERQGTSFEDIDVDEVNPSATSAATNAEGANKGTNKSNSVTKRVIPGPMEQPLFKASNWTNNKVKNPGSTDTITGNMSKDESFIGKVNKDVAREIEERDFTPLSEITGWMHGGNVSDPTISSSIKDSVDKMFAENGGIVITGARRKGDLNNKLVSEGKAVKNSRHLDGKALDLRINDASERFMKKVNSDKKYKDSLGIEDVIKHHNHIHVEWK